MAKIPILGTGLSGLVGTRVVELLGDKYDFHDLSYATGCDITNSDQVLEQFKESSSDTVLHMAAMTDVDRCEDDKILGEESAAWTINVTGTQNIVEAAKKTTKRIIYISTDFVFNGTKDFYKEDDEPDPINWYARTKYEGEKLVATSNLNFAIVRLSYPYRSDFPQRLDFVRRIIQKAKEDGEIKALADHIFTPTFIDDITDALDVLFESQTIGIFHVVGSESLTPLAATEKIKEIFDIKAKVIPVTREAYFNGRAYRPCKLALKNDKITKLGIHMSKFTQGLIEVKRQLSSS